LAYVIALLAIRKRMKMRATHTAKRYR